MTERLADDSLLQDKNPRIIQFFREYFDYPYAREVFKDQPKDGKHDANRLVADLETNVRDVLRADTQVLHTLLTTRKYYANANYKNEKNKGVTRPRPPQDLALPDQFQPAPRLEMVPRQPTGRLSRRRAGRNPYPSGMARRMER